MDIKLIVDYWVKSAEEDYKTAQALFPLKRYAHSLFFCHLTIEKILKALVVKNMEHQAPYEHNLAALSKFTGVEFTEEQMDLLDEINAYNIKARYDDFMFKFFKKANYDFSKKYFDKTTELYKWLKKQIIK